MGFEKPKHVEIALKPLIEKLLDGKIEKDLNEGEEICPTCNGFAVKITNNRYGLENDTDRSQLFPYMHQSLVLCGCPDCYNGVVRRCKFCGKLIPRSRLKCECDQQRALDREERERKAAEEFAKAPIAPPEVEKECKVFFSDYMGDGFFEDWDEFFEEWWDEDKDKEFPTRPEYVWITTPDEFRIYAENICENATNDLYEGAYEDISEEHLKRLQSFLDDWCKSSGVGVSYRVSHKYKVRIPWEDYERSYGDDGED